MTVAMMDSERDSDMRPYRFAYADPPYLGQSKRHYAAHPDYAGEVNHEQLIERMCGDFDGWALSCSMRSLPILLRYSPMTVLVLAWVKPIAPPMGDKRIYSWEPVILCGERRPVTATRTHLVASLGEKPEAFALWLFRCAGLTPADEFIDLFPGSGAVGRAWDSWSAQGRLVG